MNTTIAKRRLLLATLLAEANSLRDNKSAEHPTTLAGVFEMFFPKYSDLDRYEVVLPGDVDLVVYILNAKKPANKWTDLEYMTYSREAALRLDDLVMGNKAKRFVRCVGGCLLGGLTLVGLIAMART